LSWNNEGTANIWDFDTGNSMVTKKGLSSFPQKTVLNINENRIITWNSPGLLRIWQTDTGKFIDKEIKCLYAVEGAIFNSNETKIITWSRDRSIRIWDAATGNQIGQEMVTGVYIRSAFLNRNENQILACQGGEASLWDADTGKLIEKKITIPDVNEIVISPNYSYMLTINSEDEIQLFDTKNYKTPSPIRPKTKLLDSSYSYDGAFSDDGSLFLIMAGYNVQLWDTCSYKPIGAEIIDEDSLDGVVFTRDKTRILTWNNQRNIKLWDIGIDNDYPMNKIKLQIQVLTGTEFNPDTTEISPIEPKRWQQLKKEYLRAAAAHYNPANIRKPILSGNYSRRKQTN